jgi:hypothetical protein
VLFVDYQNAHALARDGFAPPSGPATAGQFNPLRLGNPLVRRSPFMRRLVQMRVYTLTPAREKGIDVALAVDVVRLGLRGDYEVGIIFSTDTDLEPAVEAVLDLCGDPFPRCEVAAWQTRRNTSRLSVPGARVWCHWLSEEDYLSVHDPTDYRLPR